MRGEGRGSGTVGGEVEKQILKPMRLSEHIHLSPS